jgi:Aspartyl protease
MRIVGEWLLCDDGITRPAVRAHVQGVDGSLQRGVFLVDTCADRTVLGADLLEKLGFPITRAPGGMILKGITGECDFVELNSIIVLTHDNGGVAHMRGQFAAFTDPAATDLSILGRDVLNHFDLILSRRRNEVMLIAPNHEYRVVQV